MMEKMTSEGDTLLIGLSARLFLSGGRLHVEKQTISGLKEWQKHFSRVIAFSICDLAPPPQGWNDAAAEGLTEPEFELVALPDTYRLRTLRSARYECERILLDCMERSRFRVFSYGGWIGDPGEIAAALARRYGFSHAVWLDRVESKLARQLTGSTLISELRSQIRSRVFAHHENSAVRNADLAMLHGATVYNHFREIAKNPQLVENIHLREEDRISSESLTEKLANIQSGPLRILYCGRAEAMKGGLEWVRALVHLKAANVVFRATWLGDGMLLDRMETAARAAGLTEDELSFPGFIEDRAVVLDHYRSAHLFMFCHITDESPRNLIESLHGATPIVGFRDPYAESLVCEEGAGELVDRGDVEDLARHVKHLAEDRKKLANLVNRAARSASHLTRDLVFKDRSELVRRFLGEP